MKFRKKINITFCAVLTLLLWSCVETFEAATETFEDVLVVDALLTDEFKTHRVILTRAFRFEEDGPSAESNATVEVSDNTGTQYAFEETEPGVYISRSAFAAEEGKSYTLKISTNDGKSYVSSAVQTPQPVAITELAARRTVNDTGEEGVGIFLDNSVDSDEPTFFRYEYDETYKIIAPRWDPFEFEIIHYVACDTIPYEVGTTARTVEQRVCFGSNTSKNLISTATSDLTANRIEDFQVRFIDRENYIMSHRYSINVRQFSQTPDAFTFYERLGDFSSSDNIFSQIQPGFFQGNIFSETDDDEKILGFFEVTSVSEQRVYFNYEDLFPSEPLPPYAINCENMGNLPLYSPGYHCEDYLVCDGNCESPLIEAILAGLITYADENDGDLSQPYFTWPSACGDCTKLGSNIVPEFWEDE